MHAQIKNFRGIAEAEIEISQIALICGLNGQGKTSIARAVAAAASGKPVPFDKLTKKDSGIMLRHGTRAASVTLTTDQGSTSVAWPKGDIATDGIPVVASPIAVGLVDFMTMKEDEKLAFLIDLLKATPTKDDFMQQMSAAGVDQAAADAVWKVIEDKDWVSAHKRAISKGQELKGAWSQITGVAFGTNKMEEWYPPNWEDAMGEVELSALANRHNQLRKELDDAIGKNAVSAAQRAGLEALAAKVPDLQQAVADAEAVHAQAVLAASAAEKKLGETPNPSAKRDCACPHCDQPVTVAPVSGLTGEYRLTKATGKQMSDAEMKKAREAYAAASGHQQNKATILSRAKQELTSARSTLATATEAATSLEKAGTGTTDEGNVNDLRERLARIENTKRLREQYDAAKRVTEQIRVNLKLVELLDETGIRKTKLSQEIDKFVSDFVDPICADLGTLVVSLDADLRVDVGATPYQMLSAAEQFKARTALQLAIAKKEHAGIVVIDGADIIVDSKSRGALLQAVNNSDIPAIICMSMQNAAKAPDLQAMGVGITYWVENGQCRAIQATERAAA